MVSFAQNIFLGGAIYEEKSNVLVLGLMMTFPFFIIRSFENCSRGTFFLCLKISMTKK
jgi:hypothetical protein